MKLVTSILVVLWSVSSIAATGGTAGYKGKYMFTRDESPKYPVNSKCLKVGSKELKRLSTFKSCHPFKGENPPLLETVAKCEKAPRLSVYIFEDKKTCEDSVRELSDGDAT